MLRRFCVILLWAFVTCAQNESARPSFEAATVRPVVPGRSGIRPLHGGPGTSSPGQLSGAATLKALLMRAYNLKNYQISGPAWLDSDRYEITAKVPAGANRAQVALMLQSLIAERFHFEAHRVDRQLPMYAMVVAKNGPKFKESPADGRTSAAGDDDGILAAANPRLVKGPDGFPELASGSDLPRSYEVVLGGSDGILYKLWARRETMQQLADRLSGHLDRPVIDRTGLKGQYSFALEWSVESAGRGIPRTYPPPDEIESSAAPVMSEPGLSMFTALERQLGLKLEQRKGALEMLLVDRLERTPSDSN